MKNSDLLKEIIQFAWGDLHLTCIACSCVVKSTLLSNIDDVYQYIEEINPDSQWDVFPHRRPIYITNEEESKPGYIKIEGLCPECKTLGDYIYNPGITFCILTNIINMFSSILLICFVFSPILQLFFIG